MRPTVRRARLEDLAELVELIGELATFERAGDQVELSVADLEQALFSPSPAAFAFVGEADGLLAAMAVAHWTFSTWTGRRGIHLADLFVREDYRGLGYGRALLSRLAFEAVASGARRLEWDVLDWNGGAIAFYRSLGASPLEAWTTWRIAGADLECLAASSDDAALPHWTGGGAPS